MKKVLWTKKAVNFAVGINSRYMSNNGAVEYAVLDFPLKSVGKGKFAISVLADEPMSSTYSGPMPDITSVTHGPLFSPCEVIEDIDGPGLTPSSHRPKADYEFFATGRMISNEIDRVIRDYGVNFYELMAIAFLTDMDIEDDLKWSLCTWFESSGLKCITEEEINTIARYKREAPSRICLTEVIRKILTTRSEQPFCLTTIFPKRVFLTGLRNIPAGFTYVEATEDTPKDRPHAYIHYANLGTHDGKPIIFPIKERSTMGGVLWLEADDKCSDPLISVLKTQDPIYDKGRFVAVAITKKCTFLGIENTMEQLRGIAEILGWEPQIVIKMDTSLDDVESAVDNHTKFVITMNESAYSKYNNDIFKFIENGGLIFNPEIKEIVQIHGERASRSLIATML